MRELKPPSFGHTRKAIDDMKILNDRDIVFQKALKYQYLIAGRISEVYGDYSPKGIDAYKIEINDRDAVLFAVRTAKRKGYRRAAALPYNEKYEPWVKELYELFSDCETENPFKQKKWKDSTAGRKLQDRIPDIFKGHKWHISEYPTIDYREAKDSEIIDIREDGSQYLIEDPDRSRQWRTEKMVQESKKIVREHSKNFTSKDLRSQRVIELSQKYKFTEEQLKIYSGYYIHGINSLVRDWPATQLASKKTLESLQKLAERYFHDISV